MNRDSIFARLGVFVLKLPWVPLTIPCLGLIMSAFSTIKVSKPAVEASLRDTSGRLKHSSVVVSESPALNLSAHKSNSRLSATACSQHK